MVGCFIYSGIRLTDRGFVFNEIVYTADKIIFDPLVKKTFMGHRTWSLDPRRVNRVSNPAGLVPVTGSPEHQQRRRSGTRRCRQTHGSFERLEASVSAHAPRDP